MQNLSYENEFYLHVNENSFSCEGLCTKIRFEKEVQDNSEMAYFHNFYIACRHQKFTSINGKQLVIMFSCNSVIAKFYHQVADA